MQASFLLATTQKTQMGEGSTPDSELPSADPATEALSRAKAVYAEQVRSLYHFSLPAYGGSLLCGLVMVAALWSVVPGVPLALWAIALLCATGARYALYRTFL